MSNPLQELFQQTQENYERIPAFLDELLLADVFCLGTENAGNRIQFRMLETPEGEQAIPFFLDAVQIVESFGEVDYIPLNCRRFFEMTLGATLVLNPTLSLFKEFSPDEVKSILEMET